MLFLLALLGAPVPVEDSVFGCAVLSVADLNGDGVRDIAVADAAWVRDGRRNWAVWIVSGATQGRLAFHTEAYADDAPFLRMDSIGDVDGDAVRDLVVYTSGGSVHVLSGRSLVELRETTRASSRCGLSDVAWIECGEQRGLVLGCPREGSGQLRLLPAAEHGFDSERLMFPGAREYPHLGTLVLALQSGGRNCAEVLVGSSADMQSISRIGVLSLERGKGMEDIDLSPYVPTGSTACLGDMDADGVNDFGIATRASGKRWVNVLSGKTHKTIRIIQRPARDDYDSTLDDGEFGEAMCAIDDCDGDGVKDLAIGAPEAHMFNGAVYFVSSRTGEPIREVRGDPEFNHAGCSLALADDIDHDGCRDVLVGMGWAGWMRSSSGVSTVSGKTGRTLRTLLRRDLE
jgi:hypothetical protein